MTDPGWWKIAGDLAFYGIAIFSTIFMLLYLTLAPWWKTPTGRNIAALMGTISVIGVYGMYSSIVTKINIPPNCNIVVQMPHGVYQTRFFLYVFLALAILWRIILFVRFQLIERAAYRINERKKEQDHDPRS